jgi:hypothetical protein
VDFGTCYAANSSRLHYNLNSNEGSSQTTCKYRHALNRAYGRFLAHLSEQANHGENIAEYKETVKLAQGIAKALRSPLRTFALKAKQVIRTKGDHLIGDSADVWLAFHFGVQPLMQDLHATLTILGQPIPYGRVYGQGKVSAQFTDTPSGPSGLSATQVVVLRGRVAAEIVVTNPNLFLASKLGVFNPALTAWNLVPFTWVSDWFYDVSQLLSSVSDLYGCSVKNAYWTYLGSGSSSEKYPATGNPVSQAYYHSYVIQRQLGLYKPVPVLRHANMGMSRIATALAIATQFAYRLK